MPTQTRTWFIDDARAVVDWSAAVVGGKAVMNIRRFVEAVRTVDGVTQPPIFLTYVWATVGDSVSSADVARAVAASSGDVLPPPPEPVYVPPSGGSGGTAGPVTVASITDATATGRAVLRAADASAARIVIGAGTSSLVLGTTASTAKAGDYRPTWAQVTSKPTTFPPDAHQHPVSDIAASGTASASTFLRGDGTWSAPPAGGGGGVTDHSALSGRDAADSHPISAVTGLSGQLAGKADSSHAHVAADVSDSTSVGRAVLSAVDAGAARAAIGAGTSNLALGTTSSTAKAGDYAPAWGDVTGKPAIPADLGFIDVTQAPYSADKTGVADATAAIQAAINQAVANGGGTVFLPRGTYSLSSAPTTGTVSSAGYTYAGQLLIPARSFAQGYMTVRIMGETPVNSVFWGPQTGDAVPVEVGGTIVKTTATSGNILDVIPHATASNVGSWFSNTSVTVANITFRAPNNPKCGGLNLSRAISTSIRDTTVGVDATTASIAQPTGSGIGIRLPDVNNGALVDVANSQVYGFPIGLTHTEHARLTGVSIYACLVAIRVDTAYHLSHYARVVLQRNVRQLVVGSGDANNPVLIEGSVAFESDGVAGWYATTYDVDDPNNALFGTLRFSRWNTSTMLVRGAANLVLVNLRTQKPAVMSPTVRSIVQMTQAAYTALATKDAATLYVIVG